MEKILDYIKAGKPVNARAELLEMNVVDIATLLEDVDRDDLVILFRILPKDTAAEVFSYLTKVDRAHIIESLTDKEISGIIDKLFMDDTVDFIEEMPANIVKKVLKNTDDDTRKMINSLLSYPDDSAGSIMTTEFVDIKKEMTVMDAIAHIRKTGVDKETIDTLYVIDSNRKLEGIVPIRKILLSDENLLIEDIMDTSFVYIYTLDDQEDVASMFKKYDYFSMPVTDSENRLVGIITIDDILDIIEEENEEDFAKMNALAPSDEEYLDSSVYSLAKQRIMWLLVLMISATFTGIIIRQYESVLSSVVILASFIPMLMDTGGNSGSQSSTLIIRGLALGELEIADYPKILWKEFRVSIVVGLVLAFINFLRIYLLERVDFIVSLTVCISLFATVVLAKVVGGMLPLIAKKFKLDPAIMAAPLVTTIVDTFALMVYFSTASLLMGL
ncbi:magnesium transporter [Acetoanaerobium noterae]|uniref:Magnesium transporter MgtE n=1 Tax=Acetoanaerobium noterae TaxID=745369 RepID=A0A1T5DJF3_9FIRM|nr:magnesium transporter [Acetoanaerobium noterae]SKB71878.1 magnesium transporter [Acetoanaerobium noterae]